MMQQHTARSRIGLAHRDDLSVVVSGTADVEDDIDRSADLVVDRLERPAGNLLQHQRTQAGHGIDRRVGVHGRHRAVVAGVHRLHELHGLGTANLAEHEPVGPHAQCCAQEVMQGDLAGALGLGRAGFQADDVRMRQPKLGDVFESDDPFRRGHQCGERVEQRGLARGSGPADQHVAPRRDDLAAAARRHRVRANAESGSERIAKRRIVRHGPSTAIGSITAHTREPSGSRASTVGFVRSMRRPMGRRMCSIAVVTAVLLMVATRVRLPARLDPHVAAAVDDDLVDRRVAEPPLEATKWRSFGDHVDHAARRSEMISDFGNRAISSPASTARATAGSSRTSAATGDAEGVFDIARGQ